MGGTRLTDQQRHEIVCAYRNGEKRNVLAARYGVDPSWVSLLAHRAGVIPGRVKHADEERQQPKTPVDPAEIRRLSAMGRKPTEIAALLRCPYREVFAVLDRRAA